MLRSFFCNFAIKMANLLSLGNKNKSIYFVLRSTFRNFAAKFELKDCN